MIALVFDTETTSLLNNSKLPLDQQPHLIEYYGQLVNDKGKVLQRCELICDPGVVITKEITAITGLSAKDVKGRPAFKAVADQVLEIIGGADAVVAHNLSFDYAIINLEFQRLGIDVEWPVKRICTVQESEWYKGRRLKLAELHEHLFGEPFSGAHRARQDVEALTRCYLAMRKRGDL